MKTKLKFTIASALLITVSSVCQAATPKRGSVACTVRYQNHNQIDNGPLAVSAVEGRVIDPSQTTIPNACVGLFTEDGRKLIVSVKTDDKGDFSFERIPDGKYRLVVSAGPLCAASVPLLVASQTTGKQPIVVHMRPQGLDSCSYGEIEEAHPKQFGGTRYLFPLHGGSGPCQVFSMAYLARIDPGSMQQLNLL